MLRERFCLEMCGHWLESQHACQRWYCEDTSKVYKICCGILSRENFTSLLWASENQIGLPAVCGRLPEPHWFLDLLELWVSFQGFPYRGPTEKEKLAGALGIGFLEPLVKLIALDWVVALLLSVLREAPDGKGLDVTVGVRELELVLVELRVLARPQLHLYDLARHELLLVRSRTTSHRVALLVVPVLRHHKPRYPVLRHIAHPDRGDHLVAFDLCLGGENLNSSEAA